MMLKKLFIFFICIISFNGHAQMSSAEINAGLKAIYTDYTKETQVFREKHLKKYENTYSKVKTESEKEAFRKAYSEDYRLYLRELAPFEDKKITELKNLVAKIDQKDPVIGKIKKSDIPNYKVTKPESTTGKVETLEEVDGDPLNKELAELRKEVGNKFPTWLFEESSSTLRTKVLMKVDTDGSLKKLSAIGPNEEFNLVTMITLYSLGKKIKPAEKGEYYMISTYNLPITMNFE